MGVSLVHLIVLHKRGQEKIIDTTLCQEFVSARWKGAEDGKSKVGNLETSEFTSGQGCRTDCGKKRSGGESDCASP